MVHWMKWQCSHDCIFCNSTPLIEDLSCQWCKIGWAEAMASCLESGLGNTQSQTAEKRKVNRRSKIPDGTPNSYGSRLGGDVPHCFLTSCERTTNIHLKDIVFQASTNPSEPMALNETSTTLQGIGNDVLHGFVAITGETFFLTLYAVLVFKLGATLLSKERRQHRPHLLMATILTMFLIALVLWALDFANFFIETKMTLVENINEPLSSKRSNAFVLIVRLTAVQDALYAYMSLLGDGIILYRVWTLNAYHRPWIFFLPCACLVGSSVATGMLTYCVAVNGSDIVLGSFENPAFCKNIQTVTYIMPCVTTAIATVLIGVTTWKYRRSIKNLRINSITSSENNTRSRRTQAERILVLLVESGLLYFVFFISQAIESPSVHDWIKSQPEASFATLFQYCSSVFVGLYPTIVLVLAHSKHTVVDDISTASHGDSSSSQTSSNPEPITFRAVRRRNDEEIELESGLNGQGHRLEYD